MRDIEILIQWDCFQDKTPEDKFEEALCLHMHLANQREHLDRITCEARDLVVVALAHYHAEQDMENDEIMDREKYIGDIKNIWNNPAGSQLRLLRNRWLDGSAGWSICSYEMYQHRQLEKMLGALVQLSMAQQMAPPWESNNVTRRKGGRAARRRSVALRQAQREEAENEHVC